MTEETATELERLRLQLENLSLRTNYDSIPVEDLVGESDETGYMREQIRIAAGTNANVLVHGETGTEKELVARLIHLQSSRRSFPFVPFNCDTATASLAERELFGDQNAPATDVRRRGKLEIAAGGTLFLDEVASLEPRTQERLEESLVHGRFSPAGHGRTVPLDIRVVSATREDLERLTRQKFFRSGLYGSLCELTINVFPLRDRRQDILPCARRFLAKFSSELHKTVTDISQEAADLMLDYPWPANLRELQNAMERAVVAARGPAVLPEDLPLPFDGDRSPGLESMTDVEKAHIVRMLERERWNITRTARTLGIDRVTLYNKIKKYGLRK